MGYRTYIAIIEKKKVNALRKCNTIDDVVNVFKRYGWDYSEYEGEPPYCPVYRLDYIAQHEFGKYYDNNYEEFDKNLKRIFKNKELDEYYEEYNFEYGGIEVLEYAIKDYNLRIANWFKNLSSPETCFKKYETMEKTEEELKEMHYQKLVRECKNKITEWDNNWDYKPYNMNKETNCCVSSWLYEYEIFDLVRLYKLFDPKKHYVVYYGY